MRAGESGIKYTTVQVALLTGMDRDTIKYARRLYNKNREKPIKMGEFYRMLIVTGAERILCGGQQ